MILVDDHLLLDLLVTRERPTLESARQAEGLATTGLWYYRLCHAVTSPTIVGQLSGPLASLPPDRRQAAVRSIVDLPDDITLLSLRELAPAMAKLSRRHRLNAISLEALAATIHLGRGACWTRQCEPSVAQSPGHREPPARDRVNPDTHHLASRAQRP